MNKIEVNYFKNEELVSYKNNRLMEFLYTELVKEISNKISELENKNIPYNNIEITLIFPQATVFGLPLKIEQR